MRAPGDALIHHGGTVHHSVPKRSEFERLGLLLVYRGKYKRTEPALEAAYTADVRATQPA